MEFEELKKIWDTQNNKPMYVINEDALHKHVLSKKKVAKKLANWMEVVLIGANLCAGSILLFSILFRGKADELFIYPLMALMLTTPIYLMYKRSQRKKAGNEYELNMLGDLEHALSNATYTVTLSRTAQFYFMVVAILVVLSLWLDKGASLVMIGGISLFFIVTLLASTWEHRIYVRKKRDIESLKETLEKESE